MPSEDQPGTARLPGAMAGAAGAAAARVCGGRRAQAEEGGTVPGKLKQSVSYWCYDRIPLDQFCGFVKEIGLVGVDLLDEPQWETVIAQGLTVTMCNGPGDIVRGWNDPMNHDRLVARSEALRPRLAAAGQPNMIVFSGNRMGRSDAEGLRHCVRGLRRILPLAEELGVNVVMELHNSKRDHTDYMCDRTAWGVALAQELGSPRFKLLYDIYHMQIMEGDVVATLRENMDYIGHIHTGGVPGRNEIDDTQELNYPAICRAIVETGFDGYLAHEFLPTADPIASLRQGFDISNV